MRFIVGKLTCDEMTALKKGDTIIAKMLLVPDDYQVFHYNTGDWIEVETEEGDRLWTEIRGMEVVEHPEHVIIMFTLAHNAQSGGPEDSDGGVQPPQRYSPPN